MKNQKLYKAVLTTIHDGEYGDAAHAAKKLDGTTARLVSELDDLATNGPKEKFLKREKACINRLRKFTGTIGVKINERKAKKLGKHAGSMSHRHDPMLAIQEGNDV